MQHRSVIIEADGGSRGNPGPAAYGTVLKDAGTGEVIAERAERIGVASNNVAEYRGLIAGLELYRRYADGAALEVRLDSKLVVEQMSGRWKIKHPSMRPLALEANRLAPPGTTYTWVPREQNAHADRLANEALDGRSPTDVETPPVELPRPPWEAGLPCTLVLVRHGETDHTRRRLFSGRQGADPGLSDDGRAQVRGTADWLAGLTQQEPVVVSSPLRRARESADIVSERLAAPYSLVDGLTEASFGAWEGLTYAEVAERDRAAFATWFGDVDQRAGATGDSLTALAERMVRTREELVAHHAGRLVVALTHLTPIKLLVAQALEMPLTSLFRTEIAPASVTVVAWYPDGRPVVRLLNGQPAGYVHHDGSATR
ncbi:MAG TPA: bifunctional RNase H/acid phosphatase [Marmoricola sp.]|nr:bifunctional RNase H/acid phosphatase [Marmoricola sp.]